MTNENFYAECAALLNTTYDCKPFPWYKRTRWNNRKPGSGRFPGFGLIRCFGDQVHMSLNSPVFVNRVFASKEEALQFLEENKMTGDSGTAF